LEEEEEKAPAACSKQSLIFLSLAPHSIRAVQNLCLIEFGRFFLSLQFDPATLFALNCFYILRRRGKQVTLISSRPTLYVFIANCDVAVQPPYL
jgi:hypothetical protein